MSHTRHVSTLSLLVSTALLLPLFGCGSELDEEDSQRAWQSTNAVLGQGQTRSSVGGDSAGDVSLDFTISCDGGGSAAFSADLGGSATSSTFAYTVVFSNCASQGVIIDGDLNYTMTLGSLDTTFSTSFVYTGQLDYSGDIDGSCTIDMTGSSGLSLDANSFGATSTYSGSICGHDASETLAVNAAF